MKQIGLAAVAALALAACTDRWGNVNPWASAGAGALIGAAAGGIGGAALRNEQPNYAPMRYGRGRYYRGGY